jgi:hypothetical protein
MARFLWPNMQRIISVSYAPYVMYGVASSGYAPWVVHVYDECLRSKQSRSSSNSEARCLATIRESVGGPGGAAV